MNKHIILTNGRSGSNYLAHTLNLHPNLVNYGEVLGGWAIPWKLYSFWRLFGIRETSFIQHVYTSRLFFFLAQAYSAIAHLRRGIPINWKRYDTTSNLGIKEFFIHFENRSGLQYILSEQNIAVIYLSRSDLVRRYLSMRHMEQTKVVVDYGTATARKKIHIDIADMLRTLDAMKKETDDEQAWMSNIASAGHRILEIRYEEYFASDESIARHNGLIFEFLGVPPINVCNKQRKILSADLCDLVENYGEFCQALNNSPYATYLN